MNTALSRRGRAVAASGAVVGLCAVATLAALTDAEFARGSFQVGGFHVEASQTQDFTSPSEELNFNFIPDGMITPDTQVQTTHWLRVSKGNQATVTVKAPTTVNADIAKLFDVTVTAGPCGTNGTTIQSGKLTKLNDVRDALTLPAATDTAAGEGRALCFSATLPSSALTDMDAGEYTTGKVIWPITVTEVSTNA